MMAAAAAPAVAHAKTCRGHAVSKLRLGRACSGGFRARKARRHNKSLGGDNFYGNKLALLRADATNAFSYLSVRSPGDGTALAELIEAVFAAVTKQAERLAASRELSHALRTTWKEAKGSASAPGNELFPLALVAKTEEGTSLRLRSK